jgi:FkbM family methyltransferase
MSVKIVEAVNGRFMVFENDALGITLERDGDFEPHFRQIVGNLLKPGDVCIDLGANLGYHTVGMSKLVGPRGTVIALEPLRIINQQLCGNCFLNNLRNVITIHAAIGAENGCVEMDPINYDAAWVNIGATKVGKGGDPVQVLPLDSLNCPDVRFIKVDVQGSELNFLLGAAKVLDNSRPILFMEVENHFLRQFGCDSGALLNKLLSLSYILVRINTEYPCDHLAVPREKAHMLPDLLRDLQFSYDVIDGSSVEVFFDRPGGQRSILYGSFKVTP